MPSDVAEVFHVFDSDDNHVLRNFEIFVIGDKDERAFGWGDGLLESSKRTLNASSRLAKDAAAAFACREKLALCKARNFFDK